MEVKNTKIRRRMIIVLAVLLLMTAGLIFFMSSRDATQSMGDSIGFDRILAQMLVDGFNELSPEEQYLAAVQFDEPIRHVAHFMEFTVLGLLLALLARLFSRKGWLAFVMGAGYGILDEVHQYFVAGRGCQISDICFDLAGVLAGVLVVWVVTKRCGHPQG